MDNDCYIKFLFRIAAPTSIISMRERPAYLLNTVVRLNFHTNPRNRGINHHQTARIQVGRTSTVRKIRRPLAHPVRMTLIHSEVVQRLALSTAGNSTLYIGAQILRQHVLTKRGLIHALFLGILLGTTVGLEGWGLCVLMFGVGSGLTRVGKMRKEAAGIAEARGGARKPAQVWGAAAAAAISAFLSYVFGLCGISSLSRAMLLAYACAVAAKMSDTTASEVGKAYGTRAFLVTTFREVKPGTDGAVSVVGTVAGLIASAVAGAYAFSFGLTSYGGAICVVFAATIATTAESFVGAVWQKRWNMSNELVNFVQTAIAAVLGACVWMMMANFGVLL